MNITQILSQELSATAAQITAAVELLDDGATVPFIARYRKEATGGLDDTQLRQLAERLQYLRELEERKAVVLKSIEEQGKLSDDLRAQIEAADNKTALEDLYLPYKPKRRTKAQSRANTVAAAGGRVACRTAAGRGSRRARLPERKRPRRQSRAGRRARDSNGAVCRRRGTHRHAARQAVERSRNPRASR